MERCSRREFAKGAGAATAAWSELPILSMAESLQGPFWAAVISDEISQDCDHACYVATHDFGMNWIELCSMWGKNVIDLDPTQISEAQTILRKYKLQVTDVASPLFKTDWPGTPRSSYGSKEDLHRAPEVTFKQQDGAPERSISLAKEFNTDKVRCFDFWRLEDVALYREAIDNKLRSTAETCGKQGILLAPGDEFAGNTATGREAACTMNAVRTPDLALNWDRRNAVMRNELDAFPVAWELIPMIEFTIATARMPSEVLAAKSNGRLSIRDTSIGRDSFVHSSGWSITMQ